MCLDSKVDRPLESARLLAEPYWTKTVFVRWRIIRASCLWTRRDFSNRFRMNSCHWSLTKTDSGFWSILPLRELERNRRKQKGWFRTGSLTLKDPIGAFRFGVFELRKNFFIAKSAYVAVFQGVRTLQNWLLIITASYLCFTSLDDFWQL